MRPLIVSACFISYLVLALGVRAWLHRRATGTSGLRIREHTGALGRFAAGLLVAAVGAILAAPLLAWLGLDAPRWAPSRLGDVAGAFAVAAAIAGTWWAQASMGASWRVGVDATERTALVTRGPFRAVRNPIFSFLFLGAAGVTLLLPTAAMLAGFAAVVVALELQVRCVEEPYLRGAHGSTYADYCRRVGRFVPGLGRS